MSKSVRWYILFRESKPEYQNPKQYRVDIYDEGTFTPVQLTAGPTPFVTEEDASDDFFHPVRTQTGTLQVCTKLQSGGLITLNELLPANNIERPVRLVSIASDNTETIEWQGFLSCEAYSQDYVGIPQILDMPLISVLEAMASVPLDQSRSHGLTTIKSAVKLALDEMMLQSGIDFYTHVNYSWTSYRIFNKYIDQTVLFEQKEYNNENSTTYIVSGLSVKDALERIAQYMGWVVREQGTKIYFERLGDDLYTWEDTYYQFGGTNPNVQRLDYTTQDLATDVDWRGTGHKRSIAAGAKSVEVIAKLETSDFGLKIPQFPFGDTSPLEWHNGMKYKSSTFKYFYIQINYNNEAYNNNAYSYHQGEITRTGDSAYSATYLGTSTQSDFIARLSLFPHASNQKYISSNPQVAGAILIRYAIEETQVNNPQLTEGLYCPLLPGQNGKDYPIYKMWTVKNHTFFNGKFVINAAMLFNALYRYNALNQQIMSDNIGDSYVNCQGEEMTFALRVGNMYWDGTSWVSTRKTFQIPLLDKGIECEIEANQHLSGDVELEVMAGVTVTHINTLYEVIFNSLEVGFKLNEDYQASNRSENHYFRLLSTNFRDEISIGTELASMLNNAPSPSLIMEDLTTPMKELVYSISGGTEIRRPEVDMLDRLATYYGAVRQRLELQVAHPTSAPLPLLKLNGINDGKVYLPLAESRDWQTDVCKLTCFESTEENSES